MLPLPLTVDVCLGTVAREVWATALWRPPCPTPIFYWHKNTLSARPHKGLCPWTPNRTSIKITQTCSIMPIPPLWSTVWCIIWKYIYSPRWVPSILISVWLKDRSIPLGMKRWILHLGSIATGVCWKKPNRCRETNTSLCQYLTTTKMISLIMVIKFWLLFKCFKK